MNITIIGSGNMGTALATAINDKSDVIRHHLTVTDKDLKKLKEFKDINVSVTQHNKEAIKTSDVIIICVKPHVVPKVLEEINKYKKDDVLIISIAVGITVKTLQDGCGVKKVVRAMPNMPSMIGEGINVIVLDPSLVSEERKLARDIFECLGVTIEIKNEEELNAITAISGSGPAYVFYFMRCFINAAVKLGLDKNLARTLVYQTVIGSSKLALINTDNLKELEEKVTSKGGTTEQALGIFKNSEFKTIMENAIRAAFQKANDLTE